MTAPAPAIRLTGIRKSIPPGYTLGRITAGIGDVQLVRHDDLAVKLAQTGQVLSPTTQQWQAGNVSALDSTELVINSTTITLANRGAGTLMGNPGTAAAKPSDITIGTGLTLSAAGTLSATGGGGGTGTVTNVATGAGLSGGPITTSGTIVADWNGGTVVAVGSNLAVTSGTIDVATTKLNPRQSVVAATAAALAANTYSNGTAGVGATLTGNANGALTMDEVSSFSVSDAVLVKNEATTSHNGVYLVTQIGDVSHPYILTRAPNFNTPTTVNGTGAIPVINGTANQNTAWFASAGVATIGTDAIAFSLVVPAVDGISIVQSGGTISATGTAAVGYQFSSLGPASFGAANNLGFATGGNIVAFVSTETIYNLYFPLNGVVNGGSYIAQISPIDVNRVVQAVNTSSTLVASGSLAGAYKFSFSGGVVVNPGTNYALSCSRLDGGTTFVLPVLYSGTSGRTFVKNMQIIGSTGNGIFQNAVTAISNGITLGGTNIGFYDLFLDKTF